MGVDSCYKVSNPRNEEREDKASDEELLSLEKAIGGIEGINIYMYPKSAMLIHSQNISGALTTLSTLDSIRGYPRIIPCGDL